MSDVKITAFIIGAWIAALLTIVFLTGIAITVKDIERECLLRGEVELNGEVYTRQLKEEGL